jgi:signal peptidase II
LALICVQGVIVLGLLYWLWRASTPLSALGLGLIIGGAVGNMTDRLFRGAVADFFYFHTSLPVGPLANYVFNIADVGITLGATVLLVESLTPDASRPSRPA